MEILLWIVLGGIAGWIASMIMGANANMGVLANIIVGVIGAALGGFLASLLGIGGVSGFNFTSFITAVVGAVILLWLIQLFTGAGRTSGRTL
jgi:uncharacterized membrane protein YeaQ/YmgE (transglycosylase-associated protein family)